MAGFNFGGAATGAATGGSAFGPLGAIGGGILGGLFGGKKKAKKFSTLDKRQQELYNNYINSLYGEGEFSDLFNFDAEGARDYWQQAYADPAAQQFQQEIVPGITGAFRGQNLQNSSYLGGALSKAGTDVQSDLNAKLAQILYQGQQSSLDRRMNAVDRILNMQTMAYQKPQSSPFDSFLTGLSEHAGKYIANKYLPGE